MPRRREFVLILSISLGFITCIAQSSNGAQQRQIGIEGGQGKNTAKQLVYKNEQYGFSFSLPMSWKGYRILVEQWNGGVIDAHGVFQGSESGPGITIRNPRWTEQDPYQNIPIMIFTQAQWKLIESDSLIVSAAPIGPWEIGRIAKYVFAMPARYNVGDAEGRDEVSDILQRSPIHALNSR
jgi:hypothetical protein